MNAARIGNATDASKTVGDHFARAAMIRLVSDFTRGGLKQTMRLNFIPLGLLSSVVSTPTTIGALPELLSPVLPPERSPHTQASSISMRPARQSLSAERRVTLASLVLIFDGVVRLTPSRHPSSRDHVVSGTLVEVRLALR